MLKKIHKCDLVLLIITFIFTLGVYFFHSQVYSPVAIQNSSSLSYSKAKVLRVIDDQSKKDETTNRYYGVQSLYVEILDGSYKIKKFISIIIFQQHIMYVLKMEKHLLLVLIIPDLIIL